MSNAELNFADIYEIKDFFISQLGPRYFNIDEINQFNTGMLGYATEMNSVAMEETFNAMNTMYKEQFISRATFEDTIFTQAGILGIDGYNATPAKLKFGLFIKESDIVNERNFDGEKFVLVVPKTTNIYIESISYSIDYDIVITAFDTPKGIVYTAEYDMSIPNSISEIKTAQIRALRSKVNTDTYVTMVIDIRQYTRFVQDQDLIISSAFNYPTVDITYSNDYAGMDILYRDNEESPWIPLQKIFTGAPPLKQPFVYYKHLEKGLLQLSFTTRDNYFKPDYNSELKIVVYQTKGTEGNFKEYTGTNVGVTSLSSSDYGVNIIPIGYPIGPSHSGRNMKTIEQLRQEVIEKNATSGAYNTDNDLETYFNRRSSDRDGTFVKFIKRRDDLAERLYSCFGLYKDDKGDFYHTNTLGMKLFEKEFDAVLDNGNRFLLQPGKKLVYSDTNNYVTIKGNNINEPKSLFTYTNPFLISMQKNPNSISFYQNSIIASPSMEFWYSSRDSAYQFAVNNIAITRNAVAGEKGYKFKLVVKPFFEFQLTEDGQSVNLGADVKMVLSFREGTEESKVVVMDLESFSIVDQTLTYAITVDSIDEISTTERVTLDGLYDVVTGVYGQQAVPMIDTKINITVMINDGEEGDNPFKNVAPLEAYRRISSFTNETDSFNLITPLKHIRTTVKFFPYYEESDDDPNSGASYYMMLDLVPLISYALGSDYNRTMDLFKEIEYTYKILNEIMGLKTQNYSLDLKFYNTYGKGKNYRISKDEMIDRVNISIKLSLGLHTGFLAEDVVKEVKDFIKLHVEDLAKAVNKDFDVRGYNSIYISVLTQTLQNTIPAIKFIVFKALNDYDPYTQLIEHESKEFTALSKDEQRGYVPEYLTIDFDEIIVDLM